MGVPKREWESHRECWSIGSGSPMGVPPGVLEYREWESHGSPTGSGTRHGSGSPMGVPWESQRECSSIGSEIGSRESGGSLPAAVGLGGAGEKRVVFQNKSVSRKSLRPGRGGPAESHRGYYEGGGLLWSPPRDCSQGSMGKLGSLTCPALTSVGVFYSAGSAST